MLPTQGSNRSPEVESGTEFFAAEAAVHLLRDVEQLVISVRTYSRSQRLRNTAG